MMALGSKATFAYSPSDDEVVEFYKKTNTLRVEQTQAPIEGVPLAKREEIRKILLEAEAKLPI